MSLNKKINFFTTIRFKLTLLYSVIVFLFCGSIVFALNIYLTSYLKADPILKRAPMMLFIQQNDENANVPDDFNTLQLTERSRIRDIRLNDLSQIQDLSLLALFPIGIISFVLGYFVSGRFLKPIDDLKHNIDKISRTDLGKEIPVEIEDEVGGLIMSFNELSTRLKISFDNQERFVQDASHEIKTPLTIIQTNLDTVLDDPKATKEELQLAINKALSGVKALKKLTNYLLDLTITQQIPFQKINLFQFLKNEIDKLAQFARQNDVEIKLKDFELDVFIMCQEIPLGRAISNVIENAIKYHGPLSQKEKAKVEVSLNVLEKLNKVKILIHDNGIGIPQESISKIFTRFFRVEGSRNKKTGGFGLGLAITKKVILEHHGQISVESEKNNTNFTITLPLV